MVSHGGGEGYSVYCSVKTTVGVANHHHEKKSTPHKFFAGQFFYPLGPFWALSKTTSAHCIVTLEKKYAQHFFGLQDPFGQ